MEELRGKSSRGPLSHITFTTATRKCLRPDQGWAVSDLQSIFNWKTGGGRTFINFLSSRNWGKFPLPAVSAIVVALRKDRQKRRTTLTSIHRAASRGIAALVPVGSAPAPSHKTPEPQRSCRACGTYLHGRNAPGNNWPSRLVFLNNVPIPRRYAPDQPLDHRAWQWPRHD
jgi:hypothetical protein